MDCNLDVNSYVFRNIEKTVGDIGKIDIHTGTGVVNQKFGSKNLGIINKLNDAFKEKVISYFAPTDNDLPGTIQVTLSDRIYKYYLKKYGTKPLPEAYVPSSSYAETYFENNPTLADKIYDLTSGMRLAETHKLTNTPIGDPVSQTEGTGLCDGTCGIMAYRLKEQGMPYGTTQIPDKYANYHAVALTKINDKTYILNQPQLEFMSRGFQEAPVWERAEYWANSETTRFNRHLSEFNALVYGLDIPLDYILTGRPVDNFEGTISPVVTDIKTEERIVKIKNERTGELIPQKKIFKTATLASDPTVKIRWKYFEGYEEELELFSTKDGEEIVTWAAAEMTPRLIEATEENLMNEYKLTKKEATQALVNIERASITSGKESEKTMKPEQAKAARDVYAEFLFQQPSKVDYTAESEEGINKFKEFLSKRDLNSKVLLQQQQNESINPENIDSELMNKQLSLFSESDYLKLDIDKVSLSKKTGKVTINEKEFAHKNVNTITLEELGYSPEDIGRILKKIC